MPVFGGVAMTLGTVPITKVVAMPERTKGEPAPGPEAAKKEFEVPGGGLDVDPLVAAPEFPCPDALMTVIAGTWALAICAPPASRTCSDNWTEPGEACVGVHNKYTEDVPPRGTVIPVRFVTIFEGSTINAATPVAS